MPPLSQPLSEPPGATPRTVSHVLILAAVLIAAAGLRFAHLGQPSLWYDEVIPMRLARQATPAALMRLLFQIEATRAPLHPLVLQGWLRVFGPTDLAGRTLAALCGLLTVVVVERIGRRLYDSKTGLGAAWLCTVSPLLVAYSQEVKMYSWLVLLTCLSWDLLFSLRESAGWPRAWAFVLSQAALFYSHPLGGFMIVAQGAAYLAVWPTFAVRPVRWFVLQGGLGLLAAPWIIHYLDHPPEYILSRLPIKYLLGFPIGFIGGDFRALAVCLGLIVVGLIAKGGGAWRIQFDRPASSGPLLIWFALPPALLYGYSWVGQPIFGPARYTLFVGPAYLLLVARGLVKLPWPLRWPLALIGAGLAGNLLWTTVYPPGLKADWRSAAVYVRNQRSPVPVVVISDNPQGNREVETARYYLGPGVDVLAAETALDELNQRSNPPNSLIFAVGLRQGVPVAPVPEALARRWPADRSAVDFPGLRLETGNALDEARP